MGTSDVVVAIMANCLVDGYGFSAITLVDALSIGFQFRAAITGTVAEIGGYNIIIQFDREVTLNGLSEVGETMVRHGESQPF